MLGLVPPDAPSTRCILHADMDAFYASIEQRDRPELRGLPVIVGATSPRGVVAAASYEARVFGVRSAMPGFLARQRCPQGVFLKPDMERYARVSSEVHAVFAEFTPEIEPLALDEAFLDVTRSVALFGGPLTLARRLKARVRERTGLAVSVGVATSKLVAKIACTWSKPDGLIIVPEEAVRWLLDPLPVRRLWSVGPVLNRSLERLGIRTIGELARFDPRALEQALGERAAPLQRLARGQDTRPVESDRDPKSIGEENTFEIDVRDPESVRAALAAHAHAVARRLRAAGFRGRTVTLKVKLAQRRAGVQGQDAGPRLYPVLTRSNTLDRATNEDSVLREAAYALWEAAGVRQPVRLLGVSVSNLERAATEQLGLFDSVRTSRPAVDPVLDAIQARFGRAAIGRAVVDPQKVTPTLRRKRGE